MVERISIAIKHISLEKYGTKKMLRSRKESLRQDHRSFLLTGCPTAEVRSA